MAELKLRVSLDTSYLKGQISRLPLEFAGANVSIRPKFDKQAIVSELAALNRYISSKKFNIVINTNLEAEIKNADRLVRALGRVQQAASGARGGLPIGTQRLSRTKGEGGFAAAEIKALFGAAVQGGLIDEKTLATTRAQMVTALGSIGRDSIAGLLNGLKSGDADIQKAAQMLGSNLINSFKTVLGIASPSKEFKKLGEAAGQGFEQGLLKSIEIAEQSATRKMQRMLDRLARMALMMSGMSGPEIGRQIAQARALPSLNFGATTPRTSVSIGPSSTGRALPPAASRIGLPGTSFASQKLLSGDLLTPSMKGAIRDAANDFVDGIRQRMNEAIRQIKVEDLGRVLQRTLPGSRVAGYLPPVARFGEGRTPSPYSTGRLGREGETRSELFARREREARMRSALRGVDVMGAGPSRTPAPYSQFYRASPSSVSAIVPYAAGGAIVPSSRGGGGAPPVPPRGVGGGGSSFGGMQFNVPQLPGAGLVREIGTEFGFAAKQVLLFGTAYKALAFIQGFPSQVGDAVGALQSFRNTLGAISPSAEEAAVSSQFILDVVDKYNTPIQSARDGFTKLYASMKPTGFSGNEIRDLFLGISQAAATFGMSAEKVDRVNYAFAQMASKGQVMSEELKGQLGDVLPGAMGIFAEAAGFTGPDAITKFSKALEDGAYKGAAMKTLLTNVGIVMRKEFGPGAEGAARTFQGVINRMQNSFKLLYESFEPVAVGFLNAVVMPVTSGLKTLTDGFNAFFTGQAAQTAGGSALAKQLNDLKPSFDGIIVNLKQLTPSFQLLGNILLGAAKAFTVIAGNPISGFLLKLYANVLLVNGVFTLLGGKILVTLISSIGTAIARFIAFNVSVATMQRTAAVANSTLAGTQLQMALLQKSAGMAIGPVNLLKAALIGLANFGLIAIAINVVINGLAELDRLKQSLDKIGGFSSAGYRKELKGMSKEDINSRLITNRATEASIKKELKDYEGLMGPAKGLATGRDEELRARLVEVQSKEQELIKANRTAKTQVQLQSQVTGGSMGAIPPGDGGGATGAKAKEKKGRESQVPQLMLQLEKTKELSAVEMQIVNAQLMNNTSQLSSLELLKRLIEFKYEAKSLGLEDLTTEERALKYKEIGLRREQAIFENQLQLQIDLKKERDEIQQGFAATLAGYQEEANFQQMYLDLINQGVLPSLAKVRVEAEKAFAEGEKKLNQSIEQIQLNIAGLELTIEALKLEKNLTPEKQKQLEADEKRLEILKEDLRLRGLLKDTAPERRGAAVAAGERAVAPKTASEYIGEGLEAAQERLAQLTNAGYQLVQAANAIGDAFGEAFKGVITGSMTAQEALAGFFQNIANYFADMVAQMIAEWLKAQLIQGFQSLFSAVLPGLGGAAGGIGGAFAGSAGGAAGFGGSFDAGIAPLPNIPNYSGAFKTAANGAVWNGGFQAFANGGIVTGPTLGLVGEGRYNEAVIPLPDGKSVPVDLGGMAGGMGGEVTSNIVVNINNGQMQGNGNSNGSELGRKIEGAVKQVLVSELRPGGILSSGRR